MGGGKGRYKYDANASALQVYLQSPSSPDAAYYMDEFKVRLIEPATDPGDGTPGEHTVVWDFEDGTTMDWGPRDSETVEAVQKHSGGYGLKVHERTNSWNGPSQDVKDIMVSQKRIRSQPMRGLSRRLPLRSKYPFRWRTKRARNVLYDRCLSLRERHGVGGAERNLWLHFGYGNIEAVYGNLGSFQFLYR